MDGSRQRGGIVTDRRGPGGGVGEIARERITRSLPVAPARASASGRAAHCPSCFSRHRDRLILLPPSLLASGPGGWIARSLAFLTPFFTEDHPFPHPSVSLFPPGPRTPSTIRCRTSVQRNFAQWRNLAITIACPYSPGHTLSPILLPYRSLTSLPQRSQPSPSFSFLIRARVALCIPPPPSPPTQINGGCGGPFGGPDSCTSII